MQLRTIIRALVTVGTVTALVMPMAGYAETYRHRDPAGDVDKTRADTGDDVTAPGRRAGDIVGSTMHYDRSQVRITLRMAEVPKTWIYIGRLRTPDRNFVLNGVRKHNHIDVDLESRHAIVQCAVHRRQDRASGTVTMTLASSCLGTPRWVRIGVFLMHVNENGTAYADVALRDGGAHTSEPPLSRRIHHA